MDFDKLNIDNLDSIDNYLKDSVKELFELIKKDKKSYKKDVLDKIASDLIGGKFNIIVPNDVSEEYTQKDGLSGIDEEKYLKDKEIVGRIIIFPAQLKKSKRELLKTLSHEFEHYVCQSNVAIAKSIDILASQKERNNLEFSNIYGSLPELGGFCGNLIEYKNGFEFYEEASTEIVSSDLIHEECSSYINRVKFFNGALVANGKNISDLKLARRSGNIDFLKDLIPEKYLYEIPRLENELKKNLKDEEKMKEMKFKMDKVLFEYIDHLYSKGILGNLDLDIQENVISNIMEASVMGTSYNRADYKKGRLSHNLKNMVNNQEHVLQNSMDDTHSEKFDIGYEINK